MSMFVGFRRMTTIGVLGGLATAGMGLARADEVVKIGHVAPLTGANAEWGKDTENGARLAVEEINAKGLVIDGHKVTLELDAQDDASDPRQGTQVAQKLVDDHVAAVVGHMNSGTTIPASKIYSDAGIVEVSPSATNPVYTQQGFKTAYRVVATDAQQGPALANYAQKDLKAKTVAIVDDATAYGQGLANEFEKQAKVDGLTVLSHDATNDKAVDFRSILTKIKGEHPDIIMYGGMDATGGRLPSRRVRSPLLRVCWVAMVCAPIHWRSWRATPPTTLCARLPACRSKRCPMVPRSSSVTKHAFINMCS
jgi:branched-chain amino acid transport system substrate-binding protein